MLAERMRKVCIMYFVLRFNFPNLGSRYSFCNSDKQYFLLNEKMGEEVFLILFLLMEGG